MLALLLIMCGGIMMVFGSGTSSVWLFYSGAFFLLWGLAVALILSWRELESSHED